MRLQQARVARRNHTMPRRLLGRAASVPAGLGGRRETGPAPYRARRHAPRESASQSRRGPRCVPGDIPGRGQGNQAQTWPWREKTSSSSSTTSARGWRSSPLASRRQCMRSSCASAWFGGGGTLTQARADQDDPEALAMSRGDRENGHVPRQKSSSKTSSKTRDGPRLCSQLANGTGRSVAEAKLPGEHTT